MALFWLRFSLSDPCPSPESIHLAYQTYYSPREVRQRSDYAALSPSRKLRRQLVNGYTNWRYSTCEIPATVVGVIVLSAAWPLRTVLDRDYRHLPRLPKGGGALLDLGCGNGWFLGLARACGWDVAGPTLIPKRSQIVGSGASRSTLVKSSSSMAKKAFST